MKRAETADTVTDVPYPTTPPSAPDDCDRSHVNVQRLANKYRSEMKKASEVRIRFIWPSYFAERFICIVETFDLTTKWEAVVKWLQEEYGIRGWFIKERGCDFIKDDNDISMSATLKDHDIIDGETLSFDCPRSKPFLIYK